MDIPYEATAADLLCETQKEASMHRRTFALLTGAAVTGPALDLLLDGAGPLRAAQDGDRVSAQLAQVVQRTVRQARDLDDSEGSTSALLWAAGIWQNLAKVLTGSRYRAPEGIRLHTAYIEMSETYGWMLFDAGKHPQTSAFSRPDCDWPMRPRTTPMSTGQQSTYSHPRRTRRAGSDSTTRPTPCWALPAITDRT